MNEPNQKQIGQRIKEARQKANLTQYQLYRKTGISTTQISSYENGGKSIGLFSIAKIASALNTTIDELYFGSGSTKPITDSTNTGELIVNCIVALFDQMIVRPIPRHRENKSVYEGVDLIYRIGFVKHVDILDDLVSKLKDFEEHKSSYPNPKVFREQLIASAINQINEAERFEK